MQIVNGFKSSIFVVLYFSLNNSLLRSSASLALMLHLLLTIFSLDPFSSVIYLMMEELGLPSFDFRIRSILTVSVLC